jgi:hypothetical protein
MPLPNKREGEKPGEFIARCMSDPKINEEYPDQKQRTAVCMSKACEGMSHIEAADFQINFEEYGFTEDLTEDNWYCPTEAEYETDIEWNEPTEEWDISEAKPGLWENIRKKKEREGKNYKPAKKGDKDRPDPDAWKKAQSKEDFKPHTMYDKNGKPHEAKTMEDHLRMKKQGYTHTKASFKYEDPKTGEVYEYQRKGIYRKNGRTLVPARAAEYQGRKVQLGKPFRTPKGPKKFSVYVKNEKGNVVKVNFGDPNMKIKKSDPARRKSFRARHNCANPGPRWKARYWSCRKW